MANEEPRKSDPDEEIPPTVEDTSSSVEKEKDQEKEDRDWT